MAKNLTDLTARTATADTDLLHVNAGGTDYKQTKANFKKDLCQRIGLADDSPITTQVDALGTGTYCGYISSYQHQTETAMPANDSFWLYIDKSGNNNIKIEAKRMSTVAVFYLQKNTNGWGNWVQAPTRTEVDTLKEKVKYLGNVAPSSSSSFTVANGTYALVFTISTGAARCAGWFVYATNSGVVYAMEMFTPGTNISVSTGTNQITITNSNTGISTQACCVVFNGSITAPT